VAIVLCYIALDGPNTVLSAVTPVHYLLSRHKDNSKFSTDKHTYNVGGYWPAN